jgi:hypothetical protein
MTENIGDLAAKTDADASMGDVELRFCAVTKRLYAVPKDEDTGSRYHCPLCGYSRLRSLTCPG